MDKRNHTDTDFAAEEVARLSAMAAIIRRSKSEPDIRYDLGKRHQRRKMGRVAKIIGDRAARIRNFARDMED